MTRRTGFFRSLVVAALVVPGPARAGLVANQQAAAGATAYLELSTVQNADGSWGPDEDVRPVYTAAVVNALRAYNARGSAYFSGVSWLENRAMANVDDHARRAAALSAHGDDVTADREFLKASDSQQLLTGSGWALSDAYAPSARDTALVLLAFGVLGVAPDEIAEVQAGLDYLKSTQAGDGSFEVVGAASGDVVITVLALRALAAHVGLDGTVVANANLAASYLASNVDAASPVLQQAHAALALVRFGGAGSATVQIDALVAAQFPDGSFGGDAYATGVALEALSVELGRDAVAFQQVVSLGDFELRSAVNLGLGRNRGDTLRRGDLQELSILAAGGFAISSLSGLEEATSLTFVDLRDTNVSDITPIQGLVGSATILLQNTPWAGLMCDVSDDGAIGVGDAVLSARIAAAAYGPSLLEQTRADIAPTSGPGDGVVDVGDAVLMMRRGGGEVNGVCP